ncbi:MAG: regulatory protein RecX [Lachnoclostridium sp.]
MIVTRIDPVTKTKFRVYIDGQFAFVLYKSELSRYHIKENEEVTEDVFRLLKEEVVLKRAKLWAMHLLNDMDRTEEQLITKLKHNDYTDDIIEKTMEYVKSFGYVNDDSYARRFIESKKESKSKKEIYFMLCKKGISKESVERAMEECYEDNDPGAAIEAIMTKKHFSPDTASDEEKQKMYAYLMRKGFRYEDVRQVIQVSGWNA